MSAGEPSQILAVLDIGFILNCCYVASCTIYAYDRFLTFLWEVNLIWWKWSMSVATGLYMLLHVSMAAYQCTTIIAMTLTDCKSAYITSIVFCGSAVLFRLANGGFMALRAYAIGNRRILLALAIFVLSSVDPAFDIYQDTTLFVAAAPQPIDCVISENISGKDNSISAEHCYLTSNQLGLTPAASCAQFSVTIIGQICNILAEALLVSVTWRHASTVKLGNDVQLRTPLTTALIRDGTVYFVTIFVLLLLDAVLNCINAAYYAGLDNIIYSVQAILLTHFYLNLHEASNWRLGDSSNTSQMSDLRFTRVVGQLAGSLPYGPNRSAQGTDEDDLDLNGELENRNGTHADELTLERGSIEGCDAHSLIDSGLITVEEVSRTEVLY
ncbi:hypothetical protein DAEQUDRAFT_760428 [Daedalea quercina L-15889]|uniref:Uncharacterized protein n=1 Tax=Daedalea quercina L-15889 TaxID=1314783 RepID=A0A165KSI0_9APHY|nr:hypothetical protein DAEQUDRAFT_760428 [Daedalea quercina L-15889]